MVGGAGGAAIIQAADSGIKYGLARKDANIAWKRQKRAAQNAVRWRVADLRAAGLNPILAANMGFGGGTAGSAGVPAYQAGSAAEAVSSGARSFAKAKADEKLAQNLAQATNTGAAQEKLLAAQKLESGERAEEARQRAQLAAKQRELLGYQVPQAKTEASWWEDFGDYMQGAKIFGPAARGILGLLPGPVGGAMRIFQQGSKLGNTLKGWRPQKSGYRLKDPRSYLQNQGKRPGTR